MGPRGYYARLMAKAWKNSLSFADVKVRAVVFGVVGTGVGLLLLYFFTGYEELLSKGREWVLATVGGAMAAFALVYVVFLGLAPYHVHVEEQAAHQEDMRRAAAEASALYKQLADTMAAQASEYKAAATSLAAVRAEREAVRATAADVAEEFRILAKAANKLLDAHPDQLPEREVEQWIEMVRAVVKVAIRSTVAEPLESFVARVYSPEAGLQKRKLLSKCMTWLFAWAEKLSDAQIRPECTLAALRAATATQPT